MTAPRRVGTLRRLLARRPSARRFRRGEDRGSLALAMLIMVVGAGIGALLVPMVVVQTHATTFGDSRARELNAAQAGIAVAAGMVRSATGAAGAGVATKLPCTTGGPITGTVAGSAGGLNYRATLGYYVDDPLGQPDQWLAPYTGPGSTGHGMLCSSGAGTYYPPTKDSVPRYVLITSTGSDARGSRTLRSTYTVKTSNANVAGGTVYVYPSTSTYYCMDAGSAQPIAGTQVVLQPCAKPVTPQQAWSYNSDLSIQLVSSVTSLYPNGLCLSALDASGTSQSANDPATGKPDPILLQPCAQVGSAPWSQMWSVDNNAHLEGAKTDKSGMDGFCIQASSQGAGVRLALAGCTGGTSDTKQTWVPSPDAGAGGAGWANSQVVNFAQFGRCIDVTNQSVTGSLSGTPGGNNFLIAYTCKQDPNPSNVAWNQKFAQQGATWVTMFNNTTAYCLASPKKAYDPSKPGPWVSVVACKGADPSVVDWTRYGATDANGNLLPADQRYTIQDSTGLCLSLNSANSADYYNNNQYAKVVVAVCDGSTVQKWNAQPDVAIPALTDLTEIGTPTG